MCYNNCSYFNRYTEKSTCRRGRDGLLPCEHEEAYDEAELDTLFDSELVALYWHHDCREEPTTLAEAMMAIKQYAGVTFRQYITCPTTHQKIALTKGQETSARIGGAMLKAMLVAANKNPANVNSYAEFGNLKFPVMVGIQKDPYIKDGRTYWNNELKKVITPAMPEFGKVKAARELINVDGAIEGDAEGRERQTARADSYANDLGPSFPSESSGIDDLPF